MSKCLYGNHYFPDAPEEDLFGYAASDSLRKVFEEVYDGFDFYMSDNRTWTIHDPSGMMNFTGKAQ